MWLLTTILLLGVISSSQAGGSVEDNASSHLNCLASMVNLMAKDANTDDKPDHAEHEDSSLAQEVAQLKASLVALEKRLEIMDNVSAIGEPLEVIHNMSAIEEQIASNFMNKIGQNVSARLDQIEANVSTMKEGLINQLTVNMSSLEARLRSDLATRLATIQTRVKTSENNATVVDSDHFTDICAMIEEIELDFLANISALKTDIESNIQHNISNLSAELESNLQYITNVSALRQALESEHRHDKAAINQRLDQLKEEVTANMSSLGGAAAAFRPKDCSEVFSKSPYYSINQTSTIYPDVGTSMRVVCQDEWTVIQNRVDGSVDFNQNWNSYRHGFGGVGSQSNFWLGLGNIHTITSRGNYTLRVLIKDWEGEERYADYAGFYVENEANLSRLRYSSFLGGTAGDGLGMGTTAVMVRDKPFSTHDNDNDGSDLNLANKYEGGWWYGSGDRANLNGKYHHDHTLSEGIEWDAWQHGYSYKGTTMMVKSSV